MEYLHPVTKKSSPIPWFPEESKALGIARYMDANGCLECGAVPTGRYIEGNLCVTCLNRQAVTTWELWRMGSPDRPADFVTTPHAASALGLTAYYKEMICRGGPHFVQPHIKTGRCVKCEQLRRAAEVESSPGRMLIQSQPDMVLPKDSAITMGFDVYRTGDPCRRGHRGWRYVSSGACLECLRPHAQVARVAPVGNLETITVEQQAMLFIGYWHVPGGVRDPDGKKWNPTQFDCFFPGPARYLRKDGGEPVAYAYAAFKANFQRPG